MLSLSLVTVLLIGVTAVGVRAGFSWRSLMISVGVIEILGLVLLGLPGGAFLEAFQPVMVRIGLNPITGDAAWPAAIVMSLVWPLALVPAYLVARATSLGNWQRGLVAFVVLKLACWLVAILVYVTAG
jgi:hypothetical protein